MEAQGYNEETKPRELKRRVAEKVGDAISSINDANHVDQVIVALYSLVASLFPVHHRSFSGSVDEKLRDKLFAVEVPGEDERTEWRNVFYQGSAFRAFSRVLLYDLASNWLACFPTSARKQLYDVFFLNGWATETLPVVVPCLQKTGTGSHDINAVCLNAERLLVLCLLENNGVLQIVRDFSGGHYFEDLGNEQLRQTISVVSQLITSIPDKARRGAPASLSPNLFFNAIVTQLLHGALEQDDKLVDWSIVANDTQKNGAILFVGATFSRICRRGFTDALLSNIIPLILGNVRKVLSSSSDLAVNQIFESKSSFCFWLKIMEAINDYHSVERIAEELLHHLAVQNVNDVEGYWFLWILFGQLCKRQCAIRSIFMEKFILWKVFPTCCLRWILHFSVFECAPDNDSSRRSHNTLNISNTVQRLVLAWSKSEFVQSATVEQQAYVTAALGLCMERLAKEDLDATKDALPSILQGISCRLESPLHLVRKMGSSIALVFSKIIDPENPLYLDDSCQEETVDWGFGLGNPTRQSPTPLLDMDKKSNDRAGLCVSGKEIPKSEDSNIYETSKASTKDSRFDVVDPNEVIDPATLNDESVFCKEESDYESEDSESSNDSLQPYDLTDDAADLTRRFSQLADIVGVLRKSNDAEGVEKALDVAEKLIRASPDELKYMSGDLAKTLVMVRCSDISIEGEEASTEEKRQKALVALIATCPVESLDSLAKLLYSPNVDVSQRIMILDIMTNAAEELAQVRILKLERPKTLVSSISNQPWFVPRNTGEGPWKKIPSTGTRLDWFDSYERELPSQATKRGKTRRWSLRPSMQEGQEGCSQNSFPQYAAYFMLPVMQKFDKKSHGVDFLGRDFIVLGKLIHMLGVCMKCAATHPEASVLASPLLNMLRSREVSHHAESYVRRAALFTASCVLLALHPSFVASAVVDGNVEILEGLEWVRTWALRVAESDTDKECHMLATACLQLHAEMVLQASRALESMKDTLNRKSIHVLPNLANSSIKLPF